MNPPDSTAAQTKNQSGVEGSSLELHDPQHSSETCRATAAEATVPDSSPPSLPPPTPTLDEQELVQQDPSCVHSREPSQASQSLSQSPEPSHLHRFGRWLTSFSLRHFVPLGLLLAIAIGILWPPPGKALSRGPWALICVAAIFFISGLTLETKAIKKAATSYWALTLGTISILGITPLLALPVQQLPLKPQAFQTGLAIFCAVPTTLSSGQILTAQAHGDSSLALLLCVLTNLIGILTTPFMLKALISGASKVQLAPLPLLLNLLLTILLPLAVGKVVRHIRGMGVHVARFKRPLSLTSSTCLIAIPWIRVSAAKPQLVSVAFGQLALLLSAAAGVHAIFLLLNFAACGLSRLEVPQIKAVVIQASEKTMPVALAVIQFLHVPEPEQGLYTIPIILAHLAQILMDSALANKMASWGVCRDCPLSA